MRTIKYTTQFKRDYKREKRRHGLTLDDALLQVTTLLIMDTQLPKSMHDHLLVGNWKDHRDCHIKPDLYTSIKYMNSKFSVIKTLKIA